MGEEEEKEVLCELCGEKIEKAKGTRKNELSYQQQARLHNSCINKHLQIIKKHEVSPNNEMTALLRGLLELHPEVEQTKPVFDYRNKQDMAKEEVLTAFPRLREKEKEKKENAVGS